MEAKKDLITYAPPVFLPLILKETDPSEFGSLCNINDRIAALIQRRLALGSSTIKIPPIGVDPKLLLFKQVFNDNNLLLYGTSHIKEVLQILGDTKKLNKLDKLIEESVQERRDYLRRVLKSKKMYSGDGDEFLSFALNIWISPATFRKFFEKLKDYPSLDENNIKSFINLIWYDEDYLVNWGIVPILFKLEGEFGHSPKIEKFIRKIISNVRNMNIQKANTNDFPYYEDNTRIVQEGSLFYRGYRTYRGAEDCYRSFAWFAFDVVSTMSYLVPPTKEDNKKYLASTLKFTNTYPYCSAVGGTAIFRAERDLKLLDFSNLNTLKAIRVLMSKGADQKVIQAFESGWGLDGTSFQRNSVDMMDEIVAKWICDQGYDGYIAVGLSDMHDEILVCKNNMKYVGDYDARKYMNFHVCNEPYSLVDTYLMYW